MNRIEYAKKERKGIALPKQQKERASSIDSREESVKMDGWIDLSLPLSLSIGSDRIGSDRIPRPLALLRRQHILLHTKWQDLLGMSMCSYRIHFEEEKF